jgi:putative nucleotidyltransferase with HDIG domain
MIEFLRSVSIFSSLSPAELERVSSTMEKKTYPAGVTIFEENAPAEDFYVILSGRVEIVKKLDHNKEITLARLGSGYFFGEMAALEESVRSASVRTLETTQLLELSHKEFITLIQSIPMLTYALLRALSSRLRDSDDRMITNSARLGEQLHQAYLNTVTIVANAIEAKDSYTGGHIDRVSALAIGIARKVGMNDEEELAALRVGALLHDVGKIGVPDAILSKPGRLSEAEYEIMKNHIAVGKHMLQDVYFLEKAIPIMTYHHERYDGKGYPDKLAAEDIPLGARILSVVDAFDAMTTNRPYRQGMAPKEALEELKLGAGTQFDPKLVAAFVHAWESGAVMGWLAALPGAEVKAG